MGDVQVYQLSNRCFKKGVGRIMNAQEAIEIIENQITEIEELIYDRVNLEEGGYISFNQRIVEQKELTDLKEALSIVLESAKYLHENLIKEKRYWNDRKITLKLNTVVADLTHITTEKADQLGIEVEK
ncbi:MAG: hypothetical protein L0J35_00795 [Tetragenococcus halophilus]|nr:hypothetical protein [Tetragenococcus halophilus]